MDIHGYDMLNLEGPRQNFGGKTAMVTMAKNFSSKRGMQYLEHPPHHHLAPWELQTHWFLQDICCNLPSMKAIPSCASLHLTGSYLGALSIHIYPPQLQGTPWKWWAAWPTAAGQTPQRRLHGCTWWAETWKRETIHQLLQHSSCLSDKSNALEFCPATKPFKFLTARFHHISPQQFMLAQGILPILFGIFGKKHFRILGIQEWCVTGARFLSQHGHVLTVFVAGVCCAKANVLQQMLQKVLVLRRENGSNHKHMYQTLVLQPTIPLVSSDCSRDRGKSYLEGQIYDSSSLCGITFFRSHGLYSEAIVAQMLHKKETIGTAYRLSGWRLSYATHVRRLSCCYGLPSGPSRPPPSVPRSWRWQPRLRSMPRYFSPHHASQSGGLRFAFDLPQPAVQSTASRRILSF